MRMTIAQYDLLRKYAEQRGFPSRSAYLRYTGFAQLFELQDKVTEVHQIVKRLEAHLLPTTRR